MDDSQILHKALEIEEHKQTIRELQHTIRELTHDIIEMAVDGGYTDYIQLNHSALNKALRQLRRNGK